MTLLVQAQGCVAETWHMVSTANTPKLLVSIPLRKGSNALCTALHRFSLGVASDDHLRCVYRVAVEKMLGPIITHTWK